ncbi:hypothetical protein GPECTOR_30g214 [Gonium pectorale]|uniref:Uncharacterized protein n=1 Tax=Gonium pectorale TaxID=33097 RepID=A0A150GE78_GONPE|nr:hypothetical protein GPECTOR_30g214 [Gonium pectorale]|eukprot:KXZ48118.1 hypothetical protein GPECTOR_30g214 [Gonium pectorale]
MPGAVVLPPTMHDWDVHLRVAPIRVALPWMAPPLLASSSTPATIRRDAPGLQPFAPTDSIAPAATVKPEPCNHTSACSERFNLVVPTSLIERNFDIHTVLQTGIRVVFKTCASSTSVSSTSSSSSGAPQPQVHGPVHANIFRNTNPLGLTSYRVSGLQPAGVGHGCSLLGWSAAHGCLVVELASRPVASAQASAPAPPAPRLFGDCLPSPATVRKQPREAAEPQAAAAPRQQPMLLEPLELPAAAPSEQPQPAVRSPQLSDAGSNASASSRLPPLPRGLFCNGADTHPAEQLISASQAPQPMMTRSRRLLGDAAPPPPPTSAAAIAAPAACQAEEVPSLRPKRSATWPAHGAEAADMHDLYEGLDGIALLLAAHMALSREQPQEQEGGQGHGHQQAGPLRQQSLERGRPKRARVQKRLSLP